MLAAAQRRVDRQQKKVTRINDLIAKDLASPADRGDLERELSNREDALQQAAVRAALLREVAGMAHAEKAVLHGLTERKNGGNHFDPAQGGVESANYRIRKAVLGAVSGQRERA